MEKINHTPVLRIHRQTVKRTHEYRITTADEKTIGFCRLRFNPLKEPSVFSSDEEGNLPLMIFRPHGKLYFKCSFDIIDAATSNPIGYLKRKKIKSPPQWSLLDISENEHALFQDGSRGFVGAILYGGGSASSRWDYMINGKKVGEYSTEGEPVKEIIKKHLKWKPDRSRKIKLDFSEDTMGQLNRRLAIAAAILVGTMEISRPTPS
jgi:hypothetical protein